MSKLQTKIDFVVLVSVNKANANGDPLNGNRPRVDQNRFGEISDVCIKRKIRNRMQDMSHEIFVQMEERAEDGCKSLKERADKVLKGKSKEDYQKTACEKWLDVRSFGQVFTFGKKNEDSSGITTSVRGPVSIHQAVSVSPVDVQSMQITKSVNGESADQKGTDTMGMKHFVRFGIYKIKGSINVQLAEKTGFTEEDANTIKECLRTLFINDASSARPDGSMEVLSLYWWKHNCRDGQYSSAKVHNLVDIKLNDGVTDPSSYNDYTVSLNSLPGLECEVINGI